MATAGLQEWAQDYKATVVSEAPGWLSDHAADFLGSRLDASYGRILRDKVARYDGPAHDAIDARAKAAERHVTALVMAGKAGTAEFEEAFSTYRDVVQSGVTFG
jgi:hypothetical protein